MPPKASLQPELEVAVESSEGGKATLQCLFQDIPPPKITWRHEKQKVRMKYLPNIGIRYFAILFFFFKPFSY